MPEIVVYAGLFALAFFAATLLPGSSELALVGLIAGDSQDVLMLVAVATVGNVLGSTVNWSLGRFLVHFSNRRWFPVSPKSLDWASNAFSRFGIWSLLFAWLPVIGDPLTVVAGVLRVSLIRFLALVTIGKLARYIGIAAATVWLVD